MTSLIFGSIYMTHQGIVAHRRGKQREKNYKRWEDLRDEYDLQKKTTRETRSLDIDRTGAWNQQSDNYGRPEYTAREERPILTLRDQQEANDARLSWRPQESWEPSHRSSNNPFNQQQPPETHRSVSTSVLAGPPQYHPEMTSAPLPSQSQPQLHHSNTTPSAYWQNRGEIKPQKTGAAWDDGLPAPLRVSRRSFEDYEYPTRRGSLPVNRQSQTESLSQQESRRSSQQPSRTGTPVQIQSRVVPNNNGYGYYGNNNTSIGSGNTYDDVAAKLANISVEPVESHVPGGRMAELIERGY